MNNDVRTIEEIITFYRASQQDDFFGFAGDVLLPYLPKDKVAEFAEPQESYTPQPLEREFILKEMHEYMEFAWGKVEDHRGISASRSVEKMTAWLWLLKDDETRAFAENGSNYAQYGAPILKKICEVYGFPIPNNSIIERMAQGKPCEDDCDMGCGLR